MVLHESSEAGKVEKEYDITDVIVSTWLKYSHLQRTSRFYVKNKKSNSVLEMAAALYEVGYRTKPIVDKNKIH